MATSGGFIDSRHFLWFVCMASCYFFRHPLKYHFLGFLLELWHSFSSNTTVIWENIQGPPCIFAPYIFCPANCNLNFPALFGLAAVITNPCGCVNWKSSQNLGHFVNDEEFRVTSKNHYVSTIGIEPRPAYLF